PLAAGRLLPDARFSLFLPVTLLGALIACGLAQLQIRRFWSFTAILVYGPLAIFSRIADMINPAWNLLQQTLWLVWESFSPQFARIPLDASGWLASLEELRNHVIALSQRSAWWISALGFHQPVDDPAVTALVGCLGLWLLATWAGWQIWRHG